jgi:hypothetical protein
MPFLSQLLNLEKRLRHVYVQPFHFIAPAPYGSVFIRPDINRLAIQAGLTLRSHET